MDKLLWKAIYQDGSVVTEKDTAFEGVDKNGMIAFSVVNLNNNCNYTINLKSGEFIFNGTPISPTLPNGDFDIDCIVNQGYDYSENLFWYNELSCGINEANGSTNGNKCEKTFFGYLIRINIPYTLGGFSGRVVAARPMIKINNANNKVSFCTSFVFKYRDGEQDKKIIF